MGAKQFGARLRGLRKQVGMTQRELADKISVDFSYLSKIENGAVPPPTEDVISRLAEVLKADKDELLILGGRIPSGVSEVLLNDPGALQLVKSRWARRIFKGFNETTTGLHNLHRGVQDLTKDTALFFKEHRGLSRAAISVAIVVAIVTSLWLAPAAQAITIIVSPVSGTGTLGSAYSFSVTIAIENTDLLPLRSVDLTIYSEDYPTTYTFTCTNLTVPTTAGPFTDPGYTGTFGTVSVSGTAATNWVYATSGTRWGYGYGYGTATTGNITLPSGYGYGYGYSGSYVGSTDITYNVSWTSPSTWPTGEYKIRAVVYGNGTAAEAFTNPTLGSVSLEPAPVVTVRRPAAAPPPPSEVTDVSALVTAEGVFAEDVIALSADGVVELAIDEGTVGLIEGEPLSEITITETDRPPQRYYVNGIGLVYDFEPDGATFSPPITLTFEYDPDLIPAGVAEESLVIAMWDEAAGVAGEWVDLVCTVDPVANVITASVSHFTPFAVIAYTHPAVFTASDLTISPTVVDIGDTVTISAMISNTGDLTGSYRVTLSIDNVRVATKEITVTGGASEKVTFTTSRDVAGTYAVSVDGLSGTFTVREVVVPPPPAAPPVVVPPPVAPPPVVPPAPVVNWWLLGGVIAAVVVIGGAVIYFFGWRRVA